MRTTKLNFILTNKRKRRERSTLKNTESRLKKFKETRKRWKLALPLLLVLLLFLIVEIIRLNWWKLRHRHVPIKFLLQWVCWLGPQQKQEVFQCWYFFMAIFFTFFLFSAYPISLLSWLHCCGSSGFFSHTTFFTFLVITMFIVCSKNWLWNWIFTMLKLLTTFGNKKILSSRI